MYTVNELIETLKKCPKDYIINIGFDMRQLEMVAINHKENTVVLYPEE